MNRDKFRECMSHNKGFPNNADLVMYLIDYAQVIYMNPYDPQMSNIAPLVIKGEMSLWDLLQDSIRDASNSDNVGALKVLCDDELHTKIKIDEGCINRMLINNSGDALIFHIDKGHIKVDEKLNNFYNSNKFEDNDATKVLESFLTHFRLKRDLPQTHKMHQIKKI